LARRSLRRSTRTTPHSPSPSYSPALTAGRPRLQARR
jgi:hypothetical protein